MPFRLDEGLPESQNVEDLGPMKLIARLIAFGVNAKKKKRRKEDQGKTK